MTRVATLSSSPQSPGGNIRRVSRDYTNVDCVVAREALSARLDGEREPVPSARVDEHLDACPTCGAWFEQAAGQARRLRRLVDSRPPLASVGYLDSAHPAACPRSPLGWQRWTLLGVGLGQIVVACVQVFGVGIVLNQAHLLSESAAWSIALGLTMVGTALRPVAATGLAGVMTAFIGVFAVILAIDMWSGTFTAVRVLILLPVVAGTALATIVSLNARSPRPGSREDAAELDLDLPEKASRGRRRGHLWPSDGSAA